MRYPEPNEHGVYLPEQCETLVLPASETGQTPKAQRSAFPTAEIMLVRTGPRSWAAAASYVLHHGDCRGHYATPQDVDEDVWPSRESALRGMAQYLREQMARVFEDRADVEKREREWKRLGHKPTPVAILHPSGPEVKEAEQVVRWACSILGVETAPEQLELSLA